MIDRSIDDDGQTGDASYCAIFFWYNHWNVLVKLNI
jgi:hypothetical protein